MLTVDCGEVLQWVFSGRGVSCRGEWELRCVKIGKRSVRRTRARGKVNDEMSQKDPVLSHSGLGHWWRWLPEEVLIGVKHNQREKEKGKEKKNG